MSNVKTWPHWLIQQASIDGKCVISRPDPKALSQEQIDQMVYKLYDLTDDEIKIVENFHKKA